MNRCVSLSGLCFLWALSWSSLAADYSPAVVNIAQATTYKTVSHSNIEQIDYQPFENFLRFLQSTYPKVFSSLKVDIIADYSLVLHWPGKNTALKPVLFDAHYDVVPIEPGTENDWMFGPFSGQIEDGYIWGRGILDDKVTVIAYLESINTLLEQGFVPERTLLFSIAHDEEIGGNNGAARIATFLQQEYGQLEYMVGEGGLIIQGHALLPHKPMALVALAEKRYLTAILQATGEGGHSSTPTRNNALASIAAAVAALHNNPLAPEVVYPVSAMLETLGQEVGGVQGFMLRNQWLSSSLVAWMMSQDRASNALVRTTTAVTVMHAGIKDNVIPQNAEAQVNFRLLPGMTQAQLLERITAIIDDVNVKISFKPSKPAAPVADIDGLGYQHISRAIAEVFPDAVVVPGMMTATTDTPHYVDLTENIYRFHPYTLSADDIKSVHGTNERLAIDTVEGTVKLSMALIRSAAQP